MSRLVLIDGSSYLYRAFHALPPLSNPQGEPTGALFGVVNMLRATLKERPEFVAFVVDAPGRTFRDDLYAQYKANRPPMPDELRSQVEPMCQIVEALGISILRIPGVEADDVIGTLALQGVGRDLTVTISTGDKDFAQLVRPGIELVNTMTGSRMDSDAAVMDKFGVRADQIVDLLALMGDTVDNVPGVEKCGPKTSLPSSSTPPAKPSAMTCMRSTRRTGHQCPTSCVARSSRCARSWKHWASASCAFPAWKQTM